MRNPLNLIRDIFTKPASVLTQTVREFPRVLDQLKAGPNAVSPKDIEWLKTLGLKGSAMWESPVGSSSLIRWEKTGHRPWWG
jgi:hypothetical protein